MHRPNSSSSQPSRFLLILIVGFVVVLGVWLLALGLTISSVVSETADAEQAHASILADRHNKTVLTSSSSSSTTTHSDEEDSSKIVVDEPVTVETIQKLKLRIHNLERALGSGGGSGDCSSLRDELFRAIDQQSVAKHDLGDCKKQLVEARRHGGGGGHHDDAAVVVASTPVPSSSSPSSSPPPADADIDPVPDSQQQSFTAEASGGSVVLPPPANGDDAIAADAPSPDGPKSDPPGTIPILVLCYNRAGRVKKLLDRIHELVVATKARHPKQHFRVVVSQDADGRFPEVGRVIREAQQRTHKGLGLVYLAHNRDDTGATADEQQNGWEPYYAISKHYAWALATTFTAVNTQRAYQRAIVLEEDLELADDFFDYMAAMAPLFDQDTSLYCVSGFNDNGKSLLVGDPYAVYRSDFFPGLGWMLPRRVWERELRAKWPKGFWDDWMRQPSQRRGRACLRPEVPRSRALCEDGEGTSQGQFCEHLNQIVLFSPVFSSSVHSALPGGVSSWATFDTRTLLPSAYDAEVHRWVTAAKVVYNVAGIDRFLRQHHRDPAGAAQDVMMTYASNDVFEILAQSFNLMSDFKDNVPRTAYKGVVTFRWRGSGVRAPYPPRMLPFDGSGEVVRIHLVAEKSLYK